MQTQEATEKAGRRGRKTGDDAHIACPFSIIADTREQLPYDFIGYEADAKYGRRLILPDVVRATLSPGDYSIKGLEHVVRIERKSKEDIFATIGQNRERFAARLAEMNKFPVARVMIEATWEQIILDAPSFTILPGKNVFRQAHAWQMDFPNVHWWNFDGRSNTQEATFRILWQVWERSKREMPRH